MLNRGVKRLALFSIFLYIFLIYTGYTTADIFAERTIARNAFSAISLDFTTRTSFNSSRIASLFHSLGFEPGGFDLGAVRLRRASGNEFKYRLTAAQTNGDRALCEVLNLDVLSRSLGKLYGGRAMDISLRSTIANDNPEDWIFLVSLDERSEALKNKICEFNFDFRTYRASPDERGGIFAQRLIGNVVSSGTW